MSFCANKLNTNKNFSSTKRVRRPSDDDVPVRERQGDGVRAPYSVPRDGGVKCGPRVVGEIKIEINYDDWQNIWLGLMRRVMCFRFRDCVFSVPPRHEGRAHIMHGHTTGSPTPSAPGVNVS